MIFNEFTTSRQKYIPIIVIICIGLCLSILMFFYVRNKEHLTIKSDFNFAAWNRINSLKKELEVNIEALRSLHLLYENSEFVTREEFRMFCQRLLSRHRNIQALEWIPCVPHSQRKDYEKNAQIDGYLDFQITKREIQGKMVRADEKKECFPVYYMEPYKGNESALGFDLATNPARLEALNESRNTGKEIATSRITLVQEEGNQYGFLVFIPVYSDQVRIDTIEKRRENLIGFVLGVFRIEDIVETSLSHLKEEYIDIHLFDKSASYDQQLLFMHLSQKYDMDQTLIQQDAKYNNEFQVIHTFDMADRKWSVVCKSLPEFVEHGRTWYSWAFLSGSLLSVCFLSMYLMNKTRRATQVEQLISNLSSEIAKRNQAEERINVINNLREYLLGHGSFQEKLKRITNDVVKIFNADFCRIWIIKPGDLCKIGCIHAGVTEGPQLCRYPDRCLHLMASSGRYTHVDGDHRRVPFGAYKIGLLADGTYPKFITNDVTHDQRVHDHGWASNLGLVSFSGYRLILSSLKPIGVLALFSKHAISSDEDILLKGIASTTSHLIQFVMAEDALLQSEKLKSMGTITAGISHEFNNILAIISGNVQLLEGAYENDKDLTDALITIKKAADDGAEISSKMLKFTKTTQDAKAFVSSDIRDLIMQSIDFTKLRWKNEAQAKGIDYKINTEDIKIVSSIMCNPTEIREIFINFINNALDAMPEGGSISFSTWNGDGVVFVGISDTGDGMSEKVRKNVFDPFFSTKGVAGTGLGLSLAYGIITRHGGQIEVSSEIEVGTTFTMQFPTTNKKTSLITTSDTEQEKREKNLRILVVDDEEDICYILDKFLSRCGHKVKAIDNGADAIEIIKAEDFDLVLCDLAMPDVFGYDVIKTANELEKRPKIGIITGWGEELKQIVGESMKVDFMIKKPFKHSELTKHINELFV